MSDLVYNGHIWCHWHKSCSDIGQQPCQPPRLSTDHIFHHLLCPLLCSHTACKHQGLWSASQDLGSILLCSIHSGHQRYCVGNHHILLHLSFHLPSLKEQWYYITVLILNLTYIEDPSIKMALVCMLITVALLALILLLSCSWSPRNIPVEVHAMFTVVAPKERQI